MGDKDGLGGLVAISKSMVRVSLIEKVAFEQRLNRGEREPCRHQGGPGRENSEGSALRPKRSGYPQAQQGHHLAGVEGVRDGSGHVEKSWRGRIIRGLCKGFGFDLDCNGELVQGSEQGRL